MPRPHTTLLLIDAQRVIRADFAAPGAAPQIFPQRRGGSGLIEAARAALALAPGCGRNVYVAAEEIWAQVLTLPAVAVGGLNGEELSAALAFEAEPLSGISSIGGAIGYVAPVAQRQDGLKEFALIAMDALARDSIQAAIRKAGGKLRGICCLKDLPAVLNAKDESEWISGCAAELSQTPPTLPLIAPAPHKVSPLRYWLLGLALEAAMVAFCVTHWKGMEREEQAAHAAAAEVRAPQKELDDLRSKNEAARKELQKLDGENAHATAVLEGTERGLAAMRARIPAILKSLAKERPDDIAIENIHGKDSHTLTVEGVSLDAMRADRFAAQLEAALAPTGLHVQPLSKKAQGTAANGGPWEFSLQIGTGVPRGLRAAPNPKVETKRASTAASAAPITPAKPVKPASPAGGP